MTWRKFDVLERYIQRGWPIFPLHWLQAGRCSCRRHNCTSPGKHPKVKGGFKAASTDPKLVAEWDRKWPQANWGMRTGSLEGGGSGILVVDLDTKNQGPQSWEMLTLGTPDREDTVTVRSGGGGIHLWYRVPEGEQFGCSAGVIGPGVDIRGNDGYIIIPPSRTQNEYAFDLKPSETPISDPPAWLVKELRRPTFKVPMSTQRGGRVKQGSRHDAVKSKAIELRKIGLGKAEILSTLQAYAADWFEAGDHPVTDSELESMAVWVCSLSVHFPETDLGNAERFADQYMRTVRYCPDWKQWLVYDGKVWERKAREAAFDKAYLTIRSIYAEAENISAEKVKEKRQQHAFRSESGARMDAIIRHGGNLMRIKAREFNQHPDLLTVSNGVLDLRTGELLPHDPAYRLTRMVRVPYDPAAACPNWSAFLDLVCEGDLDLSDYLQAAVGYSLTGGIGEQVFFFIYGPGYGGKTTFMDVLEMISGDYFERIHSKALLDTPSTGQGPTPEFAKLEGARLVVSTEIPEDRRFDEALIKDLTGGDSLTARAMYQDPTRFKATHKLWLFGNHKPLIRGTDDGIWRRVRLIPFPKPIPAAVRRSHRETLAKLEAEAPGILAWAVAGAVRLSQEKVLRTPFKVAQATADYRTDQDVVGAFLEECCRLGAGLRVLKKDLYTAWRRWTESNGEQGYMKKSQSWFSRRLTDRGFKIGGAGKAFFFGVELKR